VQEDFLATESNILNYWKQPKNKHLTVQGVFLATTQQYSQLLKTTKKTSNNERFKIHKMEQLH